MPPVFEEMASIAEGGVRGRGLSREECLCPVCMEIFLEPVTLPCEHTFCKPCFLQTVDKATLCCPLCRKRVSTWARLHSRNKTLVNDVLWRKVQEAFPLQCKRRISGELEDEEEEEVFVPKPTLSEPGAVRKEYEDQVSKLQQEKQAEEEEERRASEEYIHKLLAEEEEHQREERKRKEEEDERLARTLSLQLNSSVLSSEGQVSEVTSAKKKQKSAAGQIERFLCPLSPKPSAASCSLANKENILNPNSRPDRNSGSSSPPSTSTTPGPDGGFTSVKRNSSQLVATVSKRVCLSEPAVSSGLVHQDPGRGVYQHPGWEVYQEPDFPGQEVHQEPDFPGQADHQEPDFSGQEVHQEPDFPGQDVLLEELLRRRQQEEQDLRMALLLQKKLDREEVRVATDRSRGSADPYMLRNKTPGAGAQDTLAKKPNRSRLSSPSSSSSSSAKRKEGAMPSSGPSPSPSPAHRGRKQVTLTEMFPNLGH